MRKKISIGFISLALVLLLAGAVSVYELQRLRNQSEEIVALNMRNTELADRMLTALQSQNSAILRMIFSDATTPTRDTNSAGRLFTMPWRPLR